MLVAGVDEAGRGPVIGPMVLAAVMIEDGDEETLAEAGVRDSKLVPPGERRRLAALIRELAVDWRVEVIPARTVDSFASSGGLNRLEAEVAARLLSSLRPAPETAVVDAPERKPGRFSRLLAARVRIPRLLTVAEADRRYPVVSAASILAKEEREARVADLRERLGDFGSGYPHDPKTIEFLRRVLSSGEVPPEVRRSWLTVSRVRRELGLDSLEGYL